MSGAAADDLMAAYVSGLTRRVRAGAPPFQETGLGCSGRLFGRRGDAALFFVFFICPKQSVCTQADLFPILV